MANRPELELTLQGLSNCIARITTPPGQTPGSLEELGTTVVRHLYDSLRVQGSGEPAAALLRLFMTVPYADLDEDKKRFVTETFPDLAPAPDTKCLTLMGTVGDEPRWCRVGDSDGHQAIPLMSEEWVAKIPMIARLVSELGLEVSQVLEPRAQHPTASPATDDDEGFNVFYVPEALGSSHIPAQAQFVEKHGVSSVVGFGSMLPTGHLCAVLVFSKAHISSETVKLFRPLALGVRMAVLPLLGEKIHAGAHQSFEEVESLRALYVAQGELLSVFRGTVVEQSDRLERALTAVQDTNQDLQRTLNELKQTRARLQRFEARVLSRYAIDKLRDGGTYRVAFTVGTLINAFGHFLVPYMRGREDVAGRFVEEFQSHPLLVIVSVLIAYLFPVAVQVHAAVTSRMRGHGAELRAEFPDSKPDPVFRAAPDGQIIDAGAATRSLLQKHDLSTAQDVLGDSLWARVCDLQQQGERLPPGTEVRVGALGASFLVTHAPSGNGAVNLYLTELAAPASS
jgi:hypothetical protein